MKNQLASIELSVLVSEFQHLVGAWMERVYDVQAGGLVRPGKALAFQLGKSERKTFLVGIVPMAVFASASKPSVEVSPGGFCSLLRHHLDNAKLVSVGQRGSERILELVFSSKGQQKLMVIIELFSKGNIVLLNEAGIILGAAESQKWADRTVRPGFKYSPPPAAPDFSAMDAMQFQAAILSSEKESVVKALAGGLGLSGAYAEELCALAGIDKSKTPKSILQPEAEALFSSLQQLLSREPQPLAILDGSDRVVEVFPFSMASSATAKTRHFPSFNLAVEALSTGLLDSSVSLSSEFSSLRRIKEVEFTIERQKAMIAGMEKVSQDAALAGEAIYLHYADVKQVLDDYLRLKKAFTPEQIKEYFKSNKKVVSIDDKAGAIALELPNQ